MAEKLAMNGVKADILEELKKEEGLSNGQLAERVGAKPPTITGAIRKLKDEGFVRDTEYDHNTNYVLDEDIRLEKEYKVDEMVINMNALAYIIQAVLAILFPLLAAPLLDKYFALRQVVLLGCVVVFMPGAVYFAYENVFSDAFRKTYVYVE